MHDYGTARRNLFEFVEHASLNLQLLDRLILEGQAHDSVRYNRYWETRPTLEQACVNHLRHNASDYERILRLLQDPDFMAARGVPPHVLQAERRGAEVQLKMRVLDEIALVYPRLAAECRRQKRREGVRYCRFALSRGGTAA